MSLLFRHSPHVPFSLSSVQSAPYTMEKIDGGDEYEGFAIDLTNAISGIVGFNYTVVITDGYGSVGEDGRWNGMIRELLEEVRGYVNCTLGNFSCVTNHVTHSRWSNFSSLFPPYFLLPPPPPFGRSDLRGHRHCTEDCPAPPHDVEACHVLSPGLGGLRGLIAIPFESAAGGVPGGDPLETEMG